MIMNHVEKIESEVQKYFNNTYNGHDYRLRVLDKSSAKYYTGVTLHYIFKHVLKKRFSKSNVASVIMKMLSNKTIKCLHCPDIDKMVFNNTNCPYWEFNIKDNLFHESLEGYSKLALKRTASFAKYIEDSYSNKFQSKAEMTLP